MKTARHIKLALIIAVAGVLGVACVPRDDARDVGTQDPETEAFKQALVSEEEVKLEYDNDGTRSSALNGDRAMIAGLTADAVIGTNAFMAEHFAMMRFITDLPPTETSPDFRAWQGEHDGLMLRVEVHRTDVPRGTNFKYDMTARPADDASAQPSAIFEGNVTRIETRPDELGRQGFGVVRFFFGNLSNLSDDHDVTGKSRVSFRRVGHVKQVRVRMIDVQNPNDPETPRYAAFDFVQLPSGAGGMEWFSKSDVKKDAEPLESVAVHSRWRKDHSGVGVGTVFGGSLEVDYWHLTECWDSTLIKGYERLDVPGWSNEEGAVSSCFQQPEMESPTYQDTLPDEDPEIPPAHPEEDTEA